MAKKFIFCVNFRPTIKQSTPLGAKTFKFVNYVVIFVFAFELRRLRELQWLSTSVSKSNRYLLTLIMRTLQGVRTSEIINNADFPSKTCKGFNGCRTNFQDQIRANHYQKVAKILIILKGMNRLICAALKFIYRD